MYYKDISPYEYCLPFPLHNVLNVGWLDRIHEFSKGSVSPEVVGKLCEILSTDGPFSARVNQIRGVHPCCLCDAREFRNPFLGSCEIWIPGQKHGRLYAAPSLIIHYVQEHHYYPPQEFIDSVAGLDLKERFNGQSVYDELIKVQ